jgi:hypothetical protein
MIVLRLDVIIQILIFLIDNTIKKISDVNADDYVWGDDGTIRKVLYTYLGFDKMYSIIQSKTVSNNFVMSQNGKLALMAVGVAPCIIPARKRFRVMYYVRCNEETCKVPNCSKKSIKKMGKSGFTTMQEAEQFRLQLIANPPPEAVLDGDTFDITIDEYRNVCQQDCIRKLKLRRVARPLKYHDFNTTLPIDPYYFGLFLGDGNENGYGVATADQEVFDFIDQYAVSLSMKFHYDIVPAGTVSNGWITSTMDVYRCVMREHSSHISNRIVDKLKQLNVYKNKHIPEIYFHASEKDRLQLLAGILDTDGCLICYRRQSKADPSKNCEAYAYNFKQVDKHLQIVKDTIRLVESLGMAHSEISISKRYCEYNDTYKDGRQYHDQYQFTITGKNIMKVPCKIARKKLSLVCPDADTRMCNNMTSSVKFEDYPDLPCYDDEYNCRGIKVEGNGRFLSADCTVLVT